MNPRLKTHGAILLAAIAVLGGLHYGSAQPSPDRKVKESEPAPSEDRAADEKAIRGSAQAFVKAFNAGDAKAAAAQFLAKAEYMNADGEAFEGRESIERDLAAFFKEFPKAQIEMEIDSLRFVGPRVAIEEGRTAVTREPGGIPVVQSYVAVDVLVDGDWQLASVRETAIEEPATPHDHLEPLAWLVGDWIDESESGVATTSCRWSDDGNYLIQEFQLQIAGRRAVSGQQRIGWDPLTKHIKSWVFDSRGGYSEGLWTQDEDRWIVKSHGVRPDGAVASATNVFEPQGDDSYLFESTSRIVGDETESDIRVVVVRRPPAPNAEAPAGDSNGAAKP